MTCETLKTAVERDWRAVRSAFDLLTPALGATAAYSCVRLAGLKSPLITCGSAATGYPEFMLNYDAMIVHLGARPAFSAFGLIAFRGETESFALLRSGGVESSVRLPMLCLGSASPVTYSGRDSEVDAGEFRRMREPRSYRYVFSEVRTRVQFLADK